MNPAAVVTAFFDNSLWAHIQDRLDMGSGISAHPGIGYLGMGHADLIGICHHHGIDLIFRTDNNIDAPQCGSYGDSEKSWIQPLIGPVIQVKNHQGAGLPR